LGRADGGLLALTVTTLTFVSGLSKLGGFEHFVNLKILIGGLCAALFFAILCTYFTMFGTRATEDAAAADGSATRFDDRMPVGLARQHPGASLVMLGVALAWFLFPVCLLVVAELRPRPEDADQAIRVNGAILVGVLFYLAAPFFLWSFAARVSSRSPPPGSWPLESLEPEFLSASRMLSRQIYAIQRLRLLAAFTSLAAFMMGVGLALVNASVVNVIDGAKETATSAPSSTTPADQQRDKAGSKTPDAQAPGSAPDTAKPKPETPECQKSASSEVCKSAIDDDGAKPVPTPQPVQVVFPSSINLVVQAPLAERNGQAPILLNGQLTVKSDTPQSPPLPVYIETPVVRVEKGDPGRDSTTPGKDGQNLIRKCGLFYLNCHWEAVTVSAPAKP
jgi:hypothetical protein